MDTTGVEMMAEIGAQPTLDELLQRNPHREPDEFFQAMFMRFRDARLAFEAGEKAKAEKAEEE